jgi:CheY-like chemotaxis protein
MTKERILVVEDDFEMRYALVNLLDEEGYTVDGVPNGLAALTYLEQHPDTALILLDLMMPTMNGWEFRQAQLQRPELAKIPVVIFSVAAETVIADLQACAYIKKPGNLNVLFETIQHCIQKHRHDPT